MPSVCSASGSRRSSRRCRRRKQTLSRVGSGRSKRSSPERPRRGDRIGHARRARRTGADSLALAGGYGPLTIANVQVDVYVPRNEFAGTESWNVSVTFVGPWPVADAAL